MKNLIIFLPVVFSKEIFQIPILSKTILVFLLFSVFVWSTYVINDMKDIEKDKLHPVKKNRPLASWKLNKIFAIILSILLIVFIPIVVLIYFWNIVFILFLVYLANTLFYSFYSKNIVILDVFAIAIWFIIRWLIWVFTIDVQLSYRLLIILFFGSLFLWFLKRYQELKLETSTRKSIKYYNEDFLKQIIWMVATITIMAYAFYTFQWIQSQNMIITLPIVTFGLIRYYYNIFFLEKFKEWIEEIMLKDYRMLWSILLYWVTVLILLFL